LGEQGPNFGLNADVTTFGEFKSKGQGERTDLIAFTNKVKLHATNNELLDEFGISPLHRFQRTVDRMRLENKPAWENKREVILLQGEPGCGKTLFAERNYGDYYIQPLQKDIKWFDGYCGQETMLLDEFEGNMSLSMFLQLIDRYLRPVEIKGSTVWLTVKRIIITSNSHPHDWYNWKATEDHASRENKEAALKRRFTSFYAWTGSELSEVDRDIYWPVDEKFTDRSLWKVWPKKIKNVNDLVREPLNEMEVEDIIIPQKDIGDDGYPMYYK